MSENLYTLVYISSASEDFKASDLEDILTKSRKNNPALNVTGALMLKSGIFIQVLEGPKRAVKELFAKISLDERHEKVKVVTETKISERAFEKWSMAYHNIHSIDLDWINKLLKLDQDKENYLEHLKNLSHDFPPESKTS